jgi:hypothetical protein
MHPADAMMLCVDKKTPHGSRPDHEFGPFRTGAENRGNGRQDHPRDARATPVPAQDQLRRDVLIRVVRISGALNQRLAL